MNKAFKILKDIRHLGRTRLIISAVVGTVIIGIITIVIGGDGGQTIIKAERGSVEEEILATGQTVARASVTLGFERSGKVWQSNIEIGSKVREGDTLVVLEQAELLSDLRKAEANLNKALIELDATRRTSGLSYTSARDTLIDNIKNAYIKADNAIRNGMDQFFENPGEYTTYFSPSIEDGGTTYLFGLSHNTKSEITNDRVALEYVLADWKNSLETLDNSNVNLETAFLLAQDDLRKTQKFLDKIAVVINSLTSVDFNYQSTVQGYKTTVGTARTDIVTALSNLLSAKEKFDEAPYAINIRGGIYDDVLSEEARIESLRAEVSYIKASLDKTILRAPIAGVVTKTDAKKGEIVTSGTGLISIISLGDLRVEANVSEISIGKIKEGNETVIIFDAFPNREFRGKVTYIDPAEVIVDGVPTYKITSVFSESLPIEIRSGLTANLTVETNRRDDVIKIPSYALNTKEGKYFVQVKEENGDDFVEQEVTIGLQGMDGSVEITSGLKVGEEVLADL